MAAAAGDRRETLAQLSRALELQPRLTSARFARANLLGITKRYAEAAEEYSLFLAEQPASVPGYMGQATALVMAGDFGAAERSLTVGLRNTDQNPDLMLTLGRLLVTAPDPAARDPQRGLELSRKALDGLGSPEAAETTALALAAVGRCAEAADLEQQLYSECQRTGNQPLAARLQPRLRHFEANGECLAPWL